MVTVTFDPATGRLRLPDDGIESLEWAAGNGIGVHPAVARIAEVVGAPLVRVTVRVASPGTGLTARAWLDAGFGVFAQPVGQGLCDLVVGPPAATPVIVAGLVGLGPRPAPEHGGAWRRWTAEARWMVGEGRVARRAVDVVDRVGAGLWLGGRPVRSRDVWRELCALLPTEAELSAPGRWPRRG